MSSGADLFVVCKHCGSEVSPYVTECPYCGQRLRRRAPELPREKAPSRAPRGLSRRLPWRRSRSTTPALAAPPHRAHSGGTEGRGTQPYATIALVAISCGAWVAWHARPVAYVDMTIIGPLHGDWWRLFTTQFAYANGLYAFVTIAAIAIFGWLLERRHGAAVVLAVFLGAGVTGALAATAVYSVAIVSGGNAAALGLLAAWVVPDLRAARAGDYYEGDLLGVGAFAAVLLVIPFASAEASWLAGVTGGVLGLLAGLGLSQLDPPGP
jgi:membrane associated rhomboid family serine protease